MRGTAGLDENAVSILYAVHRLALVRLAVLLVDDQASAEDVVQDAFVGLHRHRAQLRDPEAAVGLSPNRGRQRSAVSPPTAVRSGAFCSATTRNTRGGRLAALGAADVTVLRAVRSLPQRQQEILALRYWSNLTEAEIAQTLGISRGAVKSQASRAIDKLETIMKGSER
jgi:DNA-directed RNA polymerase specialized sigma24 family protein